MAAASAEEVVPAGAAPSADASDLWPRGDNTWGARGTMRLDSGHPTPAGSIVVVAGGAFSRATGLFVAGDSDVSTFGRLHILWAPVPGLELGVGERVVLNTYQAFLPVRRQQLGNPSFDLKVSGSPLPAFPDLGLGTVLHVGVPTAVRNGGLVPRALSIHVAALASWRVGALAELTTNLGYHFDNSGVLTDASFLTDVTDVDARYALGISGVPHALTYGVSALKAIPLGDAISLAPYAEVTGEVAPGLRVSQSPLRGTVGLKVQGQHSHLLEGGIGADARLAGAPRAGSAWSGVPPWMVFAQVALHFFDREVGPRTCETAADCMPGEVCDVNVCAVIREVIKTVVAAQTTFTVRGTVLDAVTHQPVPDTAVTISGYDTALSVDPTTGAYLSFPIPTDGGPIQISAGANRYEKVSVTLPRGRAGEILAVSLNLSRANAPTFGTLRGTLADRRSGVPVPHGQVFIPGLSQKLAVDPAKGTFDAPVQAGRWDVLISAPGYATQRRQITVSQDAVIILDASLTRASKGRDGR